jgi:hypothetical protein
MDTTTLDWSVARRVTAESRKRDELVDIRLACIGVHTRLAGFTADQPGDSESSLGATERQRDEGVPWHQPALKDA